MWSQAALCGAGAFCDLRLSLQSQATITSAGKPISTVLALSDMYRGDAGEVRLAENGRAWTASKRELRSGGARWPYM
ncbi:hypothetical protein GCM10011503_05190 [Henriciella pelagia]|uniref:Uncharacterized protein n=1 Tax=Henriciella pelagia TaxID=1977912 RepID=A0ABQ1J4G0_9PROT|nr:hypothetical protein GCM10011503_05190 [Henriciella pelagia]